ncbi:hypothetical protein [Paractinoplanes durhamensis]|uniref:Bulb-type lectin domain-containing protein n=1 Tax=Paractinoplanes durhamensis TaxID=113563 RepID=A0ABQ3Z9K0_9ACTN|nr:hypothetical protein [Actinoplanes durhamensis]GIE06513.1 hypothetical protein Adu01nite_78630 [Actinoplanes durhamensis]
MTVNDRPAWAGLVMRYFWRPRHGQDGESGSIRWIPVAVMATFLLGVGVAAYTGIRDDDDDASLPPPPPAAVLNVPGDHASIPVYVEPSPSASPSPSPAPSARPVTTTTPSPATRSTAPVWAEKVIASTSELTTGQSWATNRLKLTVTGGGNLVLQDQGRTVWQTGTTTGVKLVMQNDGHLVLYDAGNAAVFSSGTVGNPGAVLILRADGNMVISLNGRILFQTGTGD